MRAIRTFAGFLSLACAALFGVAFYDRYWLWRGCFNELGRCWDSATEQVYVEQAGIVWGGMAGMCVLAAALLLLPRGRRR